MTAREPRQVVERYFKALSEGDMEVVLDSLDEDITWWLHGDVLPIAGTWQGRDTVLRDFMGKYRPYLQAKSVNVAITNLLADGDQVVVELASRALTMDGAPYENSILAIFTVRDGRIVGVREYMDTLHAWNALFKPAEA